MGVDVYAEKNDVESFHRNWWWWRPLWAYTEYVGGDLLTGVDGTTNSGDGLDAEQSIELAELLNASVKDGRFGAWVIKRTELLASLPLETCSVCNGNGTLKVDESVDPSGLVVCRGCNGVGTRPSWETNYPSPEVTDIEEWVVFLRKCGGFSIC